MLARIYDEMLDSVAHLDRDTQARVIYSYVVYQIKGELPPVEDTISYSMVMAKKLDLDSTITDIQASISNGKSGGRPNKNWNNSQKPKNNLNVSQKEPKHNLSITGDKRQENIIISNDIIADTSAEGINYETLYDTYPFKSKGIDKQVCDKLITKQLEQGATLEGMLKEMKLEGLELRINQGLSFRYGKKFENWVKEYVEGMADSEDRLRKLLIEHRKRLEEGPSYKKNPWNEICELFGTETANKIFMETKQGIKLFTH